MNYFAALVSFILLCITSVATSQTSDKLLASAGSYEVQCGILSSAGMPDRDRAPRLTLAACKLLISNRRSGDVKLKFTGRIFSNTITLAFEGDVKSNVFRQLEPQTGGKFNLSIRHGVECFVPFDTEDLDDTESLVCYKGSTLRKIS